MRPIKFRAWDKMDGIIGQVHQITFGDNYMVLFQTGLAAMKHTTEIELMQFTGLLDKNGKEIYEGDILDWAGLKPIQILWKDTGFHSSMYGSEPIHLTQDGMSDFGEIIGNIYENPELLNN